MEPQIQYTTSKDGVSIAYYAIGQGPAILFMMLPLSHVEAEWRVPWLQATYTAAAQTGTFVRLDNRGFGLSERDVDDLSLDAMVLDIEAVIDHLGLESLAILAGGMSATPSIVYASRHPDRVTHLIVDAAVSGEDFAPERLMALRTLVAVDWTLATETATRSLFPEIPYEMVRAFAELQRVSIDGDPFLHYWDEALKWNAEEEAKALKVPTLILHERANPNLKIERTRHVAALIPDSRIAFISGPLERGRVAAEFITGRARSPRHPEPPPPEPAGMAVILFADIVDSTSLTEQMGDSAFRDKARQLDEAMRAIIQESGGTAIDGKLLGDGVLAVFTSASRALGAATSCGRASDLVGLGLHLGLHAGDVIREDNNVYGGAVNIAARIAGESAPDEILASQTVRDLARTSASVSFEDCGERELKGVGEPVRVWRVQSV